MFHHCSSTSAVFNNNQLPVLTLHLLIPFRGKQGHNNGLQVRSQDASLHLPLYTCDMCWCGHVAIYRVLLLSSNMQQNTLPPFSKSYFGVQNISISVGGVVRLQKEIFWIFFKGKFSRVSMGIRASYQVAQMIVYLLLEGCSSIR